MESPVRKPTGHYFFIFERYGERRRRKGGALYVPVQYNIVGEKKASTVTQTNVIITCLVTCKRARIGSIHGRRQNSLVIISFPEKNKKRVGGKKK